MRDGPGEAGGTARSSGIGAVRSVDVPQVSRWSAHAPVVRALRRERLEHRLADAANHRLTLITAPAGAGKTTLLAQLSAAIEIPVAWYQTDSSETTEHSLLQHLAAVLAPVVPELDADWVDVDAVVMSMERVSPGDVLLAIDDLHRLSGPAEAALGHLITHAPPWFHVIATCREAPRWNLPRWRVEGALLEIGADDIRFRTWEVNQLFCDVYGEPLPPADLATLARGLEGWAAGLQLFHLATRGKPASERRRALAALPARSRHVGEYLTRNVLDELPHDVQAFLLDTCALGVLTPDHCDRLRDQPGSAAVLADLERRQVFLSRIDGHSYRYHEVFRSHLETALVERDGEAAARSRFARAGALLEASGAASDAVRAYCRAEDWEAVARTLEAGGATLAEDPAHWIDHLPGWLLEQDPWVMVAAARRAVATGRFSLALDLYRRAEQLFTDGAPREMCRTERTALSMWFESGTSALTQDWRGELLQAVRGRPDVKRTNHGQIVGPPAATQTLSVGLCALLAGDDAAAVAALTPLADDPLASFAVAVVARLGLMVADTMAEREIEARAFDELLELSELARIPWLSWIAEAATALSGDAAARARASATATALERQGDLWGAALALLFAALGGLRIGDGAPHLFVDLAQRFGALRAATIEGWCRSWHRLALAQTSASNPDGVRPRAEHEAEATDAPGSSTWTSSSNGAAALRCLGGFRLEHAGRPLDLNALKPKVRGTLRLLAASAGRPVHVETIVDALWPDVDLGVGKRNVQVAISSLRKALEYHAPGGGALVQREGATYRLEVLRWGSYDVDDFTGALHQARTAAHRGETEQAAAAATQALEAYGGDLLPEEGPAEWVVRPRTHLREEALEAAALLARCSLDLDHAEGAIAACQRGLTIDRYHDGLWRLLASAHEAMSDRAAAERTRRAYSAVLVELGVTADAPSRT